MKEMRPFMLAAVLAIAGCGSDGDSGGGRIFGGASPGADTSPVAEAPATVTPKSTITTAPAAPTTPVVTPITTQPATPDPPKKDPKTVQPVVVVQEPTPVVQPTTPPFDPMRPPMPGFTPIPNCPGTGCPAQP